MIKGNLSKLEVFLDSPVKYNLLLSEDKVFINSYLDKKIALTFTGNIKCIGCGAKIKKSYQRGYCYPCTLKLAECDTCIVKPELCHFHKGTCRDKMWAQNHCMIDHFVYLANTSGIKVGITRNNQIPTRWIDQGAVEAKKFFKVSSRLISVLIEIKFASMIADKTNWRTMLKGEIKEVDFEATTEQLLDAFGEEIDILEEQFPDEKIELLEQEVVYKIDYPVLKYPEKIKSLSFDKSHVIEGILQGIKGQYLILDIGVINIRKFQGYEIEFND